MCSIVVEEAPLPQEARKKYLTNYYKQLQECKSIAKENRTKVSTNISTNTPKTTAFDIYKHRVAELAHAVAPLDLVSTRHINAIKASEFDRVNMTTPTKHRLLHLGINKWSQITNWNGTDFMPRTTFKIITNIIKIGQVTWKNIRTTFHNTTTPTLHPVHKILLEREIKNSHSVIVTITANKPFSIHEHSLLNGLS